MESLEVCVHPQRASVGRFLQLLATPDASTGTVLLPAHVPRFGGRRPSQTFDDADAFAPGAVAHVVRLGAEVDVAHRIDTQLHFAVAVMSRRRRQRRRRRQSRIEFH